MSARHKDGQKEKAIRFLEMHQSEDVLILPNAWDAATARVFEGAGFGAIGTTSAGITWSFGHPDGREETLGAVARIANAVERANAYREAGADCLFVPGVRDCETIAGLVREIDGPLNVLAGPGVPPISELKQLGVARLSTGSGPVRAALALVRKIGEELIEKGDYESMTENSLNYAETNRLFDD